MSQFVDFQIEYSDSCSDSFSIYKQTNCIALPMVLLPLSGYWCMYLMHQPKLGTAHHLYSERGF